MRPYTELYIAQKAAWHLVHRILDTWNRDERLFGGFVKVNEINIDGRRENIPIQDRK